MKSPRSGPSDILSFSSSTLTEPVFAECELLTGLKKARDKDLKGSKGLCRQTTAECQHVKLDFCKRNRPALRWSQMKLSYPLLATQAGNGEQWCSVRALAKNLTSSRQRGCWVRHGFVDEKWVEYVLFNANYLNLQVIQIRIEQNVKWYV